MFKSKTDLSISLLILRVIFESTWCEDLLGHSLHVVDGDLSLLLFHNLLHHHLFHNLLHCTFLSHLLNNIFSHILVMMFSEQISLEIR